MRTTITVTVDVEDDAHAQTVREAIETILADAHLEGTVETAPQAVAGTTADLARQLQEADPAGTRPVALYAVGVGMPIDIFASEDGAIYLA